MPDKISYIQVAQLQKLASNTLRSLSEENTGLRQQNGELLEKVAGFEKKSRAEKIAASMDAKGINPDMPMEQKVAEIMQRDNLDVLEEAVGMAASQMKIASVHEDGVEVESSGDETVDAASTKFAASLATLE